MRLANVFLAKIVVTAVFWCVPLLASPPSLIQAIGMPSPHPIVFARLLGAAYLALLVVYWHGWTEARRGSRCIVAVRAGVVSNGLAALLMVGYGVAGEWDGWSVAGQAYMWGSGMLAGAITVGLLVGRSGGPAG
jgi:hypothetical protein